MRSRGPRRWADAGRLSGCVQMQTSLLNHSATNPVLLGCEQCTGSRPTIVSTTGTLSGNDRGIAVHTWSRIAPLDRCESPSEAPTRAFSSGTWPEAFARRNPQSD
jgi:hypothetical protein